MDDRIDLPPNCLTTLGSLGAIGLGLAVGLGGVTGAVEILGKSGELAVSLAGIERDRLGEIERKLHRLIQKNYRKWLKSTVSAGRDEPAIEAALENLAGAIVAAQPTIHDFESLRRPAPGEGKKHQTLSQILLARLDKRDPGNRIFLESEAAAGVFSAMVEGVCGLARTDAELHPLVEAIRHDIQMADSDRKHAESMAMQKRLLALAEQKSVPIDALRRLPVTTCPRPAAFPPRSLC